MDTFSGIYYDQADADVDQYSSNPWIQYHPQEGSFRPSVAIRSDQVWGQHRALQNPFPGVELTWPAEDDLTLIAAPIHEARQMAHPTWEIAYGNIGPCSHDTPSESGPRSSYSNSHFGGSPSPPLPSPEIHRNTFSPVISPVDSRFYFGNVYSGGGRPFISETTYVAPHDVQNAADHQVDALSFDYDHPPYRTFMAYTLDPQEGYAPMKIEEDYEDYVETPAMTTDDGNSSCTEQAPVLPHFRRRQVSATRTQTPLSTPLPSFKVTKRDLSGKKPRRGNSRGFVDGLPNHDRPFLCTFAIYGCDSSFKSKNEWKRHVNTQHMRLVLWQCNQCPQRERPNGFNRKDLFIQHVRRMHMTETPACPPPLHSHPTRPLSKSAAAKLQKQQANKNNINNSDEDAILLQAAEQCSRRQRSPPEQTGCLFCNHTFHGSRTWDERMEHIGQHMEGMKKGDEKLVAPAQWFEDESMEAWLLREEIVVEGPYGLVLADSKA